MALAWPHAVSWKVHSLHNQKPGQIRAGGKKRRGECDNYPKVTSLAGGARCIPEGG